MKLKNLRLKFIFFSLTFIKKSYKYLRFFYNPIIYRKITGSFQEFRLESHDNERLKRINSFDVMPILIIDPNPLTRMQKLMAQEQVADPDLDEKQKQRLRSLLTKSSRMEFSAEDWKTLDIISFQLTQNHFNDLALWFEDESFKQLKQDFAKLYQIDYQESLIAEVLAKAVAHTEGLDGKTQNIPTREQLIPHLIQAVTFGESGLPGYLLIPQKLDDVPPWLIARGTEVSLTVDHKEMRKGGFASVNTDLSRNMTEDAISEFLKQKNPLNTYAKLKMTGNSLGGTIVTDIATREIDKIDMCYLFNPTGLTSKKALERMLKHQNDLKRKVISFDTEGDLVPCVGNFTGRHYAARRKNDLDPLSTHVTYLLNQECFSIAQVDVEKENSRLSRKIANIIRIFSGFFLQI